jgi:hypothetical protein
MGGASCYAYCPSKVLQQLGGQSFHTGRNRKQQCHLESQAWHVPFWRPNLGQRASLRKEEGQCFLEERERTQKAGCASQNLWLPPYRRQKTKSRDSFVLRAALNNEITTETPLRPLASVKKELMAAVEGKLTSTFTCLLAPLVCKDSPNNV